MELTWEEIEFSSFFLLSWSILIKLGIKFIKLQVEENIVPELKPFSWFYLFGVFLQVLEGWLEESKFSKKSNHRQGNINIKDVPDELELSWKIQTNMQTKTPQGQLLNNQPCQFNTPVWVVATVDCKSEAGVFKKIKRNLFT